MITSNAWAKITPALTALLWNEEQQVFRFEPLELTMATGMRVLEGAQKPDGSVLIYVGPTRDVQLLMLALQPAAEARRAIKTAKLRDD